MNPKRLNSDKAKAHVQGDEYHQGADQAAPEQESVEGIRDLTGLGYGHKNPKASDPGKLGKLGEADQQSWVDTWSPHNTGPSGAGVTIDENYGATRPRNAERQQARFEAFNPEFSTQAKEGDWTSLKWDSKV